jgi:hypothetical protein
LKPLIFYWCLQDWIEFLTKQVTDPMTRKFVAVIIALVAIALFVFGLKTSNTALMLFGVGALISAICLVAAGK